MPSSLRNQPSAEDQRNVIIATILVALIMFGYMFYFGPTPAQQAGVDEDTTQQQTAQTPSPNGESSSESSGESSGESADTATGGPAAADPAQPQTAQRPSVESDSITAAAAQGTPRDIVVETDLYTAVLSTKGATFKRFTLKNYKNFNQTDPVQLIDPSSTGALAMEFTTPTSRLVDTRSLYFDASSTADTVRVADSPKSLTFTAQLGSGTLQQTFTFHPDDYDVGLDVQQTNARSYQTGDGYELIWDGGIPFTEGGSEDEYQHSGVFAYSGGEMEGLTLASEEHGEHNLNGEISWLAVKNKYFTNAIMADDVGATSGVDLVGDQQANAQNGALQHQQFTARLRMQAPRTQQHTDSFSLYMGPIYYYQLASYGRDLYNMVDYGWDFFEWMTRPLAKFVFIPMLTYLGGYMPFGIVVILMAVFIKTLVYPLTKSSYRSMAQMRELQPRMEEIREKYDDDPQKQQEKMMELYRETGVNPLGGCLPMLFQYPIIIALYQFIPQSIQLRQKSFLWAPDLSAPDVILELPFTIPFYGDYVAGFTLLMGLSMMVTMRLQSTPSSGGGQMKVFMYAMPAVIFFIFNRFASALSLYYLFYNVVTAAQQWWINHQLDKEKEGEEEEKKPRFSKKSSQGDGEPKEKKGFFQRLLDRAQEAQKQQ